MYLLKAVKEGNEMDDFIATDDPKKKVWFLSKKPTVFEKLKDARKLRKRINEGNQFDEIEVYKLTKMKNG
jgi:hypothetical protein